MATIRLDNKDNSVKIVHRKTDVKLSKKDQSIKLQQAGRPGPQGPKGEDGIGIPEGGLPGQSLIKLGFDDYQVGWDTSTGEDKTYVQTFAMRDSILVSHNLAKYPSVTVHDSAGDEVEGSITHDTINQLTISFSSPFSGVVTCN